MKITSVNLFKGSKINVTLILFIIVALSVLICCFCKSALWIIPVVLFIVFLICKRLFFSKCLLSAGDVVYLYGGPGTGKTLTMTRIALDNSADRLIVANEEYSHCDLADAVLSSSEIGYYDFPGPSIICNDESMLDGFGSRDYQHNFEDKAKTEFIVKIRQYGHSLIYTSQRENALDILLREGLINRWYVCKRVNPWICKAEMMIKDYAVSEVTGLPQEYYRFPTIMEWFSDPSLILYTFAPYVGKHYKTENPKKLPIYPFIDLDSM